MKKKSTSDYKPSKIRIFFPEYSESVEPIEETFNLIERLAKDLLKHKPQHKDAVDDISYWIECIREDLLMRDARGAVRDTANLYQDLFAIGKNSEIICGLVITCPSMA